MNTEQLSFGQRIDPENNLVECWFTWGCLDWIKQQDWSDKVVLMFGAGMGDIWLAKKCKELYIVERNPEWLDKCATIAANSDAYNLWYINRPCNDCSGQDEYYCAIPEGCEPDIIINDDAYRFEVIVKALSLKKSLTLITDNWLQDYVFVCPKAAELLNDYESKVFSQADHKDFENEGGEWKTAIHFIK